jgi:hypothetical protein
MATSARSHNRTAAARSAGRRRSSTTDFLPRLRLKKYALTSRQNGADFRDSSPAGRSTLITSAPISASSIAAYGTEIIEPNSTTRIPSSGSISGRP